MLVIQNESEKHFKTAKYWYYKLQPTLVLQLVGG